MLTLFMLVIVLALACGAFIAVGVEDAKFHASYIPVRYQASPMVTRWEDDMPGRPVLPWVETESEDNK